jgi:asparagine synthase (glutamine-hydrolysing)
MHLAEWSGAHGLDDDYVAGFLTRGVVAERTPYPGVFSVPSGSAVLVTEDRLSTQRLWSFPSYQTRYERDRDYEEQLRVLFREAVQVRLKTPAPAAAELSGGLDSSSVVCFAHHLIASGQAPASSLTSFSYCGGGSTDEPYIRLVEEFCGIAGTHFDIAAHPFVSPEHVGASAPAFWEPRLIEVSRRMASTGSAALLTGQMGDLVMGNWLDDSEQVAALLEERKFSAALKEAFAWSHSLRVPVHSILWRAARSSVFSWSPAANRDLTSGSSDEQTHGDSLTSRFRKSFIPKLTPQAAPAHLSSACRKRFWALNAMLSARVLQCPERLHHAGYTHPYAHRPLVEFMMTVPPGVVCRPGTPRRLMRRTFADLVPAGILKRRSKATYNGVFDEAMLPLANELLHSRRPMQLVERGYIDAVSLKKRLALFREGLDCNASQLRYVILLEFWLRSRAAQAAPLDNRPVSPRRMGREQAAPCRTATCDRAERVPVPLARVP